MTTWTVLGAEFLNSGIGSSNSIGNENMVLNS